MHTCRDNWTSTSFSSHTPINAQPFRNFAKGWCHEMIISVPAGFPLSYFKYFLTAYNCCDFGMKWVVASMKLPCKSLEMEDGQLVILFESLKIQICTSCADAYIFLFIYLTTYFCNFSTKMSNCWYASFPIFWKFLLNAYHNYYFCIWPLSFSVYISLHAGKSPMCTSKANFWLCSSVRSFQWFLR